MRDKTKWLWLVLVLLVLGAVSAVSFYFISQRKKTTERIILVREGLYRIGDILVDVQKRQIQFNAYVFKNEGWVQHLIYLHGYKWLKEESAITSQARLLDFQKAIAILDWRLWDELWQKRIRTSRLTLLVRWDKKEVFGQELVLAEDKLEIQNFVFLGSPYFDPIALEAPSGFECQACPLFSLEEKALREMFVRPSGASGYELNSQKFPPKGEKIEVIIKLGDGNFF